MNALGTFQAYLDGDVGDDEMFDALQAWQEEISKLRRRQRPAMHNPDHEVPFAAFIEAMADELRANATKGDRSSWLTMSSRDAIAEVLYHAAKLAYAARQHLQGEGEMDRVREFAADVANCALMTADIHGALDKLTEPF